MQRLQPPVARGPRRASAPAAGAAPRRAHPPPRATGTSPTQAQDGKVAIGATAARRSSVAASGATARGYYRNRASRTHEPALRTTLTAAANPPSAEQRAAPGMTATHDLRLQALQGWLARL